MIYNILVKNGSVIDGKLGEIRKQDIGIKDGVVKNIGDLSESSADEIINAEGQYVCPGFIDLTTHSDAHWTLFSEPEQESFVTQGITTILGGNCGFSLAPIVKSEVVEGLQKWVDISGLNVNWQTYGEFLTELKKRKLAVNFAGLVGFGTLRRNFLEKGKETLEDKEFQKMLFLMEDAMEEGAFGLSTSLGRVHEKTASENEIRDLLKIVEKQSGLIKHHLRNEGQEIISSLAEVIRLSKGLRIKTQISHFKILGKKSWQNMPSTISIIEHARNEEKINLWLDFFPYTKTGSNLYLLLPPWFLSGGKDEMLKKFNEPKTRSDILLYLKKLTLHYEKIIICATLRDRSSLGKTIKEIANTTGLEPEEAILELLKVNEFKVSIFNEVINPEHFGIFAKKEYFLFASDGEGRNLKSSTDFDLPHPRSFGAFPAALRLFVKEKEILKWEEAIHKMTGLPASILGIKDRGIIAPGKKADIVVFSPEKIKDRADYRNPFQQSEGINYVIVNGKTALRDGKTTSERAGIALKR